ncbi:MAG: hypothetical protein PUF51_02965 [Bifidobacteriaceae bacterium]|nr:hypothetical protein [Bifidobacteriaceae bacterium]
MSSIRDLFSGHVVAILCEGSAERIVMETLLDQGLLPFTADDTITDDWDRPTILRMPAAKFARIYLELTYPRPVIVLRVLDSVHEKFALPAAFRDVPVVSCYTRPEIERLIILREGWESEWQRVKSRTKPSDFCKKRLGAHIKQEEWLRDYWTPEELCKAIREYDTIHQRTRDDEHTLADLLPPGPIA